MEGSWNTTALANGEGRSSPRESVYLCRKTTALPTPAIRRGRGHLSDPDAVRFDSPSPTPLGRVAEEVIALR
jgi:hypothetical protein